MIEHDLAELGADLLVSVVDQIDAGVHREELQDFMLCSYAPRLTKEEGLIDWTLPASIHNRVRGLCPVASRYTYLNGVRLIILQTHVEDAQPMHRLARSSPRRATACTSRPVMKDALRSIASNWKAESRSTFASSWSVIASQRARKWAINEFTH